MISDSINGVFVIAAGGVANGSFPVPSKRIPIWKWEHIWLIYSAFGMAIIPIGLALAFAPQIIRQTLVRDPHLTSSVWMWIAIRRRFGAFWGEPSPVGN